MAAIPIYTGDNSGSAPAGFADSIVQFALDAAFPGRYAYCTYTNTSGADNISILFYDKNKLGFAGIVSSYANITDFNTYKLYYLSANLATTHDTVFLYVTCNHDNSGSGSSDAATRGAQIVGEMAQIETHFTTLPNMLNMGDFNTQNSSEVCYQALVAPTDTGFRFYEPSFYPDAVYTYPANWATDPGAYAPNLTTSTRETSVPNGCGSTGGGKLWFDHIFVSSSIINNEAGISYIPHSYRAIGNDGNRVGISINAAPTNTAAPTTVIDALFQMSNKYPVMADFAVRALTPPTGIVTQSIEKERITIVNPVNDQITLHVSAGIVGKKISITCMDMPGRMQLNETVTVTGETMQIPCILAPGVYCIRANVENSVDTRVIVTKE